MQNTTVDPVETNRHPLRVLHLLAGIFFTGCAVLWLLEVSDNLSGQVFAITGTSTLVLAGLAGLVVLVGSGRLKGSVGGAESSEQDDSDHR